MKKFLIIVALLVIAAVALPFVLKPTARVAAVVKGPAVQAVPGSVIVYADYQMELKSETGGRVLKSALERGLKVTAGTFLAQLDTRDLELEIEKAESDGQVAKRKIEIGSPTKVELEAARENLAYLERLAQSGNYALAELERQRRGVKEIERKLALEDVDREQVLATFDLALKAKRRLLEKMTITAPFDGTVSQVYARPGDLIGSGSPIASIISTSRRVEASISEENFAGIAPGQEAKVRFLTYGDWEYAAKVTRILPTADAQTQRYIVYLEVEIPAEKLVPGITGEVLITVGRRQADALVPRRALTGNNVYVVADGRVEIRRVEVGYQSLTIVEILKGLKAGDQVIVEDLDKFHDGERVRTEAGPTS